MLLIYQCILLTKALLYSAKVFKTVCLSVLMDIYLHALQTEHKHSLSMDIVHSTRSNTPAGQYRWKMSTESTDGSHQKNGSL